MRKIALITTTIYEPRVLRRYREISRKQDVFFIIAGDEKTPHQKVQSLVRELGHAIYYSPDDQRNMGFQCSRYIGWNCIQRRNIALLKAIQFKPDLIITIDDDNIPISNQYFHTFAQVLGRPFSGLKAAARSGCVNIGDFLSPRIRHRGFPHELYGASPHTISFAQGARIGVAEGLWMGTPDVDAWSRIMGKLNVLTVSNAIASNGIIVDSTCFAPFNSQNTAYPLETAPLMAVLPGIGRVDDIWGSYIAQRIMREENWHVYYGPPFIWQERNRQRVAQNLEDEALGAKYTRRFCIDLLKIGLGEGCLVEKLARLWESLDRLSYTPTQTRAFGKAWTEDLGRVL